MTLIVHSDCCPQNHKCPAVQVCPTRALTQEGVAAPQVDLTKCNGCGRCARCCLMGALRLTDANAAGRS
jgi:Fe-S-cluster-containing hydrogenase component 2